MKRLLLIALIGSLLSGAALAELEGGTVSPGGMIDGQNGYELQDIKGEPAIGELINESTLIQLGGIYLMPFLFTSEAAAEDGLIRETQIFRVADTSGSDLRLTWSYAPELSTRSVDIWRLSGPGMEYSAIALWAQAASGVTGNEYVEQSVAVADGNNAYYRIVPSGTPRESIFEPIRNNRTVGKVDLPLVAKYNSITYPFRTDNYNVQAIFGDQLQEGDRILYWNEAEQVYSILTKTDSFPGHLLSAVEGIFVYLGGDSARTETLTLVGQVGGYPEGFSWPLGLRYNLISFPYPQARTPAEVGLTAPAEGDRLLRWNAEGQVFSISTYLLGANGAGWNDTNIANFDLGEGKFYYIPADGSTRTWQLIF